MLKLGRKPRVYNPGFPHLSALIRKAAPLILPAFYDWGSKVPATGLGMMLNDQLGNCTCAAYYHALQVWSSNCNPDGLMITEPDDDVLTLYERACGYDPQDPSTDQGGIEQDLLSYLVRQGAPTGAQGQTRHHLRAGIEIDVRNLDDVKRAIYEAGLVYIGFTVPQSIMPADGQVPDVWDVGGDETAVGGHAVVNPSFDENGFGTISWGRKYFMTTAFWSKFVDEAYALVDIDFFKATGLSPLGLSIPDLEAQMSALKDP